MCGFIAVASTAPSVSLSTLEAAMSAMAHRGPDDRAAWVAGDRHAGLGHVRLSIIDLHTGLQPIANEDERLRIVVNGEFYDHDRLRRELAGRGHQLRTKSDSEVALHLYEERGADCLDELRGEFAFAVWDARERTLFAARDRFGIKPLFYAEHAGRLVVASEIKALFAAGVPAAWDEGSMHRSLHFGLDASGTLYRGVKQVPPGCYLQATNGTVRVRRYWDARYPKASQLESPDDDAACLAELQERIAEAVRLRTRADVPIACYLSGGVDSSSVLGLANEHRPGQVAAFTVAFDDAAYDETPLAEGMARRAGVDFHRIHVTNADFADVFEDSVIQAEAPLLNGHGPARYLLSRAVSDAGYKVALGGEGADELFAGYHFARSALARSLSDQSAAGKLVGGLQRIRQIARRPSDDLQALAQVSPSVGWICRLVGFPPELLASVRGSFDLLRSLMHPDFLARHEGVDPFRSFLGDLPWRELVGRAPVHVILYAWMKSHFAGYVLGAERLDMGHAVEVRLPYLDHHLFEFTKRLSPSLLFRNGRNKDLLRRAVAPWVTPEVLATDKRPFVAPPTSIGAAIDNPLAEKLRSLIASDAFADLPFFEPTAVRAFLGRMERGAVQGAEAFAADPILYLLASLAALQGHYRPST